MPKNSPNLSLHERLKDILKPEDSDLLRDVRRLEEFVSSKSSYVITNGRFPGGWSFERWKSIATFLATVIAFIWFMSSQWFTYTAKIDDLQRQLSTVAQGQMSLYEITTIRQVHVQLVEQQAKTLEELANLRLLHQRQLADLTKRLAQIEAKVGRNNQINGMAMPDVLRGGEY